MEDLDDREVQLAVLRAELFYKVTGSKKGKVENQMIADLTELTHVSRNTLRRIFLLEAPPKDYFPRMDTRELLVQYLGYSDWVDFIRVKKQRRHFEHDLEHKTDLSSLPADINLPNTPFKYLQYYKREDSRIFFGRGKAVTRLIEYFSSSLAERVLLIYGQSGVGKSSFLTAGFLPRLEANWKPYYFRLSREASILNTIDLEKQNSPVIWVIDQAEVIFDPSIKDPDLFLSKVIRFLKTVLEKRKKDRIVVSFRKEYFAEFDTLLDRQEIGFKKFYLEPLIPAEVREVIEGVCLSTDAKLKYELKIDQNLVEEIAQLVVSDSDSPIAPTLQIILSKLWDESTQYGKWPPYFSLELFHQQFEKNSHILDDFIEERLDLLKEKNRAWAWGGLAIDILEFFISPISTSEDRSKKEILARYNHTSDISFLIKELTDNHLVSESLTPKKASFRLSHDALAPLIRSRFDSSVLVGQKARRLLTSRIINPELSVGPDPDNVFSIPDLELIEAGRLHTRKLSENEEEYILFSRTFWDADFRKKKRRRFILYGTILSFVLTSLIALFLFKTNQVAQKDRANLLYKEAQTDLFNWKKDGEEVIPQYQELIKLGYHNAEIEKDLLLAVEELAYHWFIPVFSPYLSFANIAFTDPYNKKLFFGEYAYLAYLSKDSTLASESLGYILELEDQSNQEIYSVYHNQFETEIAAWEAKYFPEWIPVQLIPGDTANIFLCSKTELTKEMLTFFLNVAQINWKWFEDHCTFFRVTEKSPKFQKSGWEMPKNSSPKQAISISWTGARLYCDWFGFNIPNEIEWMAAAKSDWEAIVAHAQHLDSYFDTLRLSGSPFDRLGTIDSLVWTNQSGRGRVRDVCSKSFPFFRFCDIFGNVSEWLQDSIEVNLGGLLHRKIKGGSVAQPSDFEIFSLEGVWHESIDTPVDVGLRPIKW